MHWTKVLVVMILMIVVFVCFYGSGYFTSLFDNKQWNLLCIPGWAVFVILMWFSVLDQTGD